MKTSALLRCFSALHEDLGSCGSLGTPDAMALENHFASSSAIEGAATDMLARRPPSIPAVRPLEETLGSSAKFPCTAELAPGMSLACVLTVSNGRKEGA